MIVLIKQSLSALLTLIVAAFILTALILYVPHYIYERVTPHTQFHYFGYPIQEFLSSIRDLIIWSLPGLVISGIGRYTFLPPTSPIWRIKNMICLGMAIGVLAVPIYIIWTSSV